MVDGKALRRFCMMATVGFPQIQSQTPTESYRKRISSCICDSRSGRKNVNPGDVLVRRFHLEDSSRRLRGSVRGRHLVARRSGYPANSTGGSDVDNELSSIKNLGLQEIGVDVDGLSSDVGIVDSTETLSLHREFSIPGSVRVTDGRCGIPKVNLTHPGGSFCDVYLRGGNILSWVLANGGEVFYTPDGTDLASDALSDWGTSLCFPQYGGEHQLAGTPPGKKLLPTDGLTKTANWTIAQTGLYEDTEGEYPYVIIETADSEATRAVWNNGFHIVMEIALHHSALDISLTVKNTGDRRLKYSFALKNHIAVADIEDPSANYVGFNDCLYIDSKLHESKSRVRFSKQLNKQGPLHLKKAIDRVYFQTQNDTGVDTGTGCTVYVRNLCSAEEDGFLDRAIFNPWKEQDPVNYRWYAGLAIGAIGEPIKVDAGMTRTHQTRIEVHDVSSIVPVTERMNAYNNYSVLNMASHKSNSPDDNLPHDFQ